MLDCQEAKLAQLPIPRGESPYTWGKRAEYIERNLEKAELYYRLAIYMGVRTKSAVMDLAGILHQLNKTEEACQLLENSRHMFPNGSAKLENLLVNLK